MEIREYAQTVLFDPNLDAKLILPSSLEDTNPGTVFKRPQQPARSARHTPQSGSAKDRSIRPRNLESENARALLLHQCANHELLALEVMALALLIFPQAPPGFRMGIARAMQEERSHFLLYRQRMRELGIDFGDAPINNFFWKCLRDIQTPLEYVAGMSLTFEQANLDYAEFFRQKFITIGDMKSSTIMQRVIDEEIGHVRLGASWFSRLDNNSCEEGPSWEAYLRHLPESISPARARGIIFNREAREMAGLPEKYIKQVELYHGSRGRPPRVFYFDADCERDFVSDGRLDKPARVHAIDSDLETAFIVIARNEDVLLLRTHATNEHLETLQSAGFSLPEIARMQDQKKGSKIPENLMQRKLGGVEPWCWSPRVLAELEPLLPNVVGQAAKNLSKIKSCLDDPRKMSDTYSKITAANLLREFLDSNETSTMPARAQILCPPEDVGESAATKEKALHLIEDIMRQDRSVLLRMPHSTAAGGRRLLVPGKIPMDALKFIENTLNRCTEILIEPHLDRVLDLSMQFIIEENSIRILGMTRLLCDRNGVYRGNVCGRMFDDMSPEIMDLIRGARTDSGSAPRISEILSDCGHFCGNRLRRDFGYLGPAGLDAFIYRNGENRLRLKPLCEINPRYTMGRIALEAARHVCAGKTMLMIILHERQIHNTRYTNLRKYAEDLEKRYPLELRYNPAPMVEKGVLFLSDYRTADSMALLALVASDLQACRDMLPEIKITTEQKMSAI